MNLRHIAPVAMLVMSVTATGALLASGAGSENGKLLPQTANARFKSECGACHVTYPPALLPARSWETLMAGLAHHFGEDASLDAENTREITQYLVRESGDRGTSRKGRKATNSIPASETPLRITETRWFRHEHDDISPAVWRRAAVGSAANCGCVPQGRYGGRLFRAAGRDPSRHRGCRGRTSVAPGPLEWAMRILLVEDDSLLGDGLRAGLAQDGHAVDWVRDGAAADAALRADRFALVILDLGLPRVAGLDVLRVLRGRDDATPVLVLTARDAVTDRIEGLDAGADDYLVKPFDLGELKARARALVRRAAGRSTPEIRHGDLVVDPAAHAVALNGNPVELARGEFAILHELLQNVGRVRSREQLEASLHGFGGEIESNLVEVYVHHLRRKLGAGLIKTVRGVGYLVDKAPGNG